MSGDNMLLKTELISQDYQVTIQTWVSDECVLKMLSYQTLKHESEHTKDVLKEGYQFFVLYIPFLINESSVSTHIFSYIKTLYEYIIYMTYQINHHDFINTLQSQLTISNIHHVYMDAFHHIDSLYR